jgi:hypothetical protein
MDDIIEPTIDYDFSKLYLGPPTTLAGGAYFTRLMYNTNKHLFIQTPKSLTKQGFVKSGKKVYTDLMFDNNDTVFINWIENLETKCQELIFSKGQNWFETKLEKDDIETAFTSPFKIFKSGKYYLLRVNVKQNIKIYDEEDQIINSDDITSDKMILSILEIQGIKFTSRNFQIEIELKQSMIVSPDPFLDECFIKKPIRKQPIKEVTIVEEQKENVLDDFINNSAKDLVEKFKEPIDLEISFDKIKESSDNLDLELEEANIVLDVEDLEPKKEKKEEKEEEEKEEKEKEDPNALKEIDLFSSLENNLENSLETITLKKPNQVYYEIYQKAREKAKDAKKSAIVAYLEMKNIKKTYMLDDIDESDSDFEDFASKGSNSDNESLEDNFE